MPLMKCSINGQPGWKFGDGGHCYPYSADDPSSERKAKKLAIRQALAIGNGKPPPEGFHTQKSIATPNTVVCFDSDSLAQFALPPNAAGFTSVTAPDDLHITLAFLGSLDALVLPVLVATLSAFADNHGSVPGSFNGVGCLATPDGHAFVLLFDSATLDELRDDLVDNLSDAGISFSSDHGFQPHMTLGYHPSAEPCPGITPPEARVTFPSLTLRIGPEPTLFPFRGPSGFSKAGTLFAYGALAPHPAPFDESGLPVAKSDSYSIEVVPKGLRIHRRGRKILIGSSRRHSSGVADWLTANITPNYVAPSDVAKADSQSPTAPRFGTYTDENFSIEPRTHDGQTFGLLISDGTHKAAYIPHADVVPHWAVGAHTIFANSSGPDMARSMRDTGVRRLVHIADHVGRHFVPRSMHMTTVGKSENETLTRFRQDASPEQKRLAVSTWASVTKSLPDGTQLPEPVRKAMSLLVDPLVDDSEPVEKRFVSADQRKALHAKGQTMPDMSFPIDDQADLDAAVTRMNTTKKDKGAVKAHIVSVAKKLGLKLPDAWMAKSEEPDPFDDGTFS